MLEYTVIDFALFGDSRNSNYNQVHCGLDLQIVDPGFISYAVSLKNHNHYSVVYIPTRTTTVHVVETTSVIAKRSEAW